MPEDLRKVWYDANCHCGAVRYRIRYPSLEASRAPTVNCCNCSICTKNGYLLIYPERQDVVWTQGFDHLKSYQFATKTKDHLFCPTCGSSILIDFNGTDKGGDYLAVNVRMIHDIDPEKLSIWHSDFKSGGEPYNL